MFTILHVSQNSSVSHSSLFNLALVRLYKRKDRDMETYYRDMGKRIAIRRNESKINQAELAELVGISNNHMSAIENGRQKPSLDTFVKICNALCTTPDYLLLGVMHTGNIPQDVLDKLRLCKTEDIDLVASIVELLVNRNSDNHKNKYPIE